MIKHVEKVIGKCVCLVHWPHIRKYRFVFPLDLKIVLTGPTGVLNSLHLTIFHVVFFLYTGIIKFVKQLYRDNV